MSIHIGRTNQTSYLIEIRDETSGLLIVEAELPFAEFASALGGLGEGTAKVRPNFDLLGKQQENKSVQFEVPSEVLSELVFADTQKKNAIQNALWTQASIAFEVDGWILDRDKTTFTNSHNRTRVRGGVDGDIESIKMTLRRWV